MLLPDFQKASSEGFWKNVKKEESHPGIEGVQVKKPLNV
jgi:hypothetical protein